MTSFKKETAMFFLSQNISNIFKDIGTAFGKDLKMGKRLVVMQAI